MSTLDTLGPRICILGPSNSGKSTLAKAIERQRGLAAIHLDQLFHLPFTNWQARPAAEFDHLHQKAIEQDSWVIEGNYTRTIQARLQRASGLIVLDVSTLTSLVRYLRRTWCENERYGALAGGQDSVKWDMIHHITITTPKNRRKNAALFEHSALPKVWLGSKRALESFYRTEGLRR